MARGGKEDEEEEDREKATETRRTDDARSAVVAVARCSVAVLAQEFSAEEILVATAGWPRAHGGSWPWALPPVSFAICLCERVQHEAPQQRHDARQPLARALLLAASLGAGVGAQQQQQELRPVDPMHLVHARHVEARCVFQGGSSRSSLRGGPTD